MNPALVNSRMSKLQRIDAEAREYAAAGDHRTAAALHRVADRFYARLRAELGRSATPWR